ncbi:MAG: COX15/CtaA family protein [Alphaproteobacteria bacterium]
MLKKPNPVPVTYWLLICCGLVFVTALLGAITRLTESGLSITSWDPVIGIVPPLNEESWQKAFTAYQAIPQYQVLNRGMTLEAFKGIYFWEWLHRFLDRLIGVVFAVPWVVFLVQRKINKSDGLKLALIFALGGLQGFVGWFMVQSGLEVRTSVSPYRLALHLGLALVIYSALLWTAFSGMRHEAPQSKTPPALLRHGWIALGLLAVTMTWGAFVAGLHAGEVYNTWPLMEGDVFPAGAATLQPMWHNFFENPAGAQFLHRWLGPTTMIVLLAWVARCWGGADQSRKTGLAALAGMAVVQVGLGIGTLLSHAEIVLAVLHQAGAITLLSLVLWNLQRFSDARASSAQTTAHK